MDMKEVKKSALQRISPDAKEEGKLKKFIQELLRTAKTVSGLDAVVCGSTGKFTWLRGDHDIDLFMMFPVSTERDDLEKKGLEYGRVIAEQMKGKHRTKYAEHPYTHAMISGYHVDIVPCYQIRVGEKIKSAVDRSPLHLVYVLEHLNDDLRDDVRLLKQFCKGVHVYGSDAKNQGFSGYICELLILKYGSFDEVIREAGKWKAPTTIFFRHIDSIDTEKFPRQSLILIDPTDVNRNAAAVLSAENFTRFVNACNSFSQKPALEFFFPKERSKLSPAHTKAIQNRGGTFLAITMKRPDVVEDVLYPQIRKARKRIVNMLKHNEFFALRSFEHVEEKAIIIVIELENWSMPMYEKMLGPPIFAHKHMDEFLGKYKNDKNVFLHMEGTRLAVDRPREFTAAEDVLKKLLKSKEEELIANGIPKYIADVIRKAKIIDNKNFWTMVKKDKDLSAMIEEKYFGKIT
jgi:tRNA nucleotidyltransferase (CCA-adding enzyme)